MKKAVLIPDSFKGTMSSMEICEIMAEAIRVHYPAAEIISVPVADGGEGSVDAFLRAMDGEKVTLTVKGPYMGDMEAFYGLVDGGETAVIEMAACAGLPLVGESRQAHKTTTYGVGQLMAYALEQGCKKIVIGLGGSATNDLGCGAAAAMGVQFLDRDGNAFVPVGESLCKIRSISLEGLHPRVGEVEIITMCDIDNPLYGKNGAAHIFGPQKGADPAMVKELDKGLKSASDVIKEQLGVDVADLPGAGAAGGMGGGMVAFFGSKLQMGIETVLDTVDFDHLIQGADIVFSGEGKIDHQSLRGKVVVGVARRCKKKEVPLIAVVGDIGDNIEAAYGEGVSAIFSINRVAVDYSAAKARAKDDMRLTIDNIMRFFQVAGL